MPASSAKKRTVCIVNAHPKEGKSLCSALADAYASGAKKAGAEVLRIDVAKLDFDVLREPSDFPLKPPSDILNAQDKVRRAAHLFVIYPLWLGSMPALAKAFFEQLSRNEFALSASDKGWPKKNLAGRSARVAVTMGMPAAAFRLFLGAHGAKSFETGILGMSGVRPVRTTFVGGAFDMPERRFKALSSRFNALGARLM